MARTISGTVGRSAANRHDDVVTVQELLNQVPTDEGGPEPQLKVDGLCGPKTKEAIQKFQLHHFGWKGADGRVDPGGQTLAKLNEYDERNKPKPPVKRGNQFTIRSVNDDSIRLPMDGPQWRFQVQSFPSPGGLPYGYALGGGGILSNLIRGKPRRFTTKRLYAASELECPAAYVTYLHKYRGQYNQTYGEWRSYLELRLPGDMIRIPFDSHLVEASFDGYRKRSRYERRGRFRRTYEWHKYGE